MDLPGGQTQLLKVCYHRTIDNIPIESDQNSTPNTISDTENQLDWNGKLENPMAVKTIVKQT
jgi:hypothetical protein